MKFPGAPVPQGSIKKPAGFNTGIPVALNQAMNVDFPPAPTLQAILHDNSESPEKRGSPPGIVTC